MAKKRAPKRRVWNKGLEVGKRDGFTPDQVKRIRLGLVREYGVYDIASNAGWWASA
jgi:hypothetical protein